MAKNRGKDFEKIIEQGITDLPEVSIDRFYDTMGGFKNIATICDYSVYSYPYKFYIELKAIKGNTLNFKSHITETQWNGLLEKASIKGVTAGIIVWFIDNDITAFISIHHLNNLKHKGLKSFHKDSFELDSVTAGGNVVILKGKKKRVYFDYDFNYFMERMMHNGKKDDFNRNR